jgi:hypothetical protein
MKNQKFLALFLVCFLLSEVLCAQESFPEKESLFTSNGKLGVVVAVLVTILAGIFVYLISLDKKISQLEKKK